MTDAIAFSHVGKTYSGTRGTLRALDNISFTIGQGEFFGLLVPNGAGKTTLISILAGLARATEGTVTVMGHERDLALLAEAVSEFAVRSSEKLRAQAPCFRCRQPYRRWCAPKVWPAP
jgi:ABC-type multidrug transport system ATPase subunit